MSGRQFLLILLVWYPFWVIGPGGWLLFDLAAGLGVSWRVRMMASIAFVYGIFAPIVWLALRADKRDGGRP